MIPKLDEDTEALDQELEAKRQFCISSRAQLETGAPKGRIKEMRR